MKKLAIYSVVVALCGSTLYAVFAAEKPAAAKEAAAQAEPAKEEAAKEPLVCFESRKGASEIPQKDVKPGWPNVKCSPTTGAALWYGDPFDSTVPMGNIPQMAIPEGKAVVKPRSESLALMPMCGTACHNGVGPQFTPPKLPKDKRPAPIPTMAAMVPDLANFEHGRGRIWCMDCHHTTQRVPQPAQRAGWRAQSRLRQAAAGAAAPAVEGHEGRRAREAASDSALM